MTTEQKMIQFFDSKNLKPRENQIYVLKQIAENWDKYKYFILNCPTGVGKTYIATAVANSLKPEGRAYLTTSTLQLQTQYEGAWDELVNIKGRSNYTCNLNDQFTVDVAPCTIHTPLIQTCRNAKLCSYFNKKEEAFKAQSMITNPMYLLYSALAAEAAEETGADPFEKRDLLIVDEAHNLEKHIISFSEVEISFKALHEKNGVLCDHMVVTENPRHNYELLQDLNDKLFQRKQILTDKLKEEFPGAAKPGKAREWAEGLPKRTAEKAKRWRSQLSMIDSVLQPVTVFLQTYEPDENSSWLLHPNISENTLTITPLRANFLFEHYFDKIAERFIFMSATPGDFQTFCGELGIPIEQALYVETDTPFPPDKSPVVVFPILKMGYKDIDKTMPALIKSVDEILAQHADEKGIIHCGTYKIANEILLKTSSTTKGRLIARDKTQVKMRNEEMLALHASDKIKNSVLLSPSMMEGVDLFDDLSRFQLILKMPWASLADPRIQAKSKLDADWYANQVWMHIMQASGRSTRHEDDESITYVLDASFTYFYNQWKHRLPTWFKKRVQVH